MVKLRSILTLLLLAAPMAMEVLAQPPVGGPPPCWPPPCIPIDGGVGFLALAGALYGGRKAMELRRTQRNADR
ncbi:MAG: hypothetical protein R2810_04445 [Flavobacteriales bacterium]|nr:hypothetical protein [Flavobacteriales bacterium]MCB0782993.1 hypothetical protein [Flavobacteriales bacterium]MCB0787933.1 hypothetical protein [Flavobacteriales bacterium]MCB0809324.1 hypothetical protein [Flavobacteriales bacterium]MCB0815688.1 hypothetical protein [Flavobacteriales bacterium]